MDYKQLQEINQQLGTTNIKGKDYVEVNERIKGFRALDPNGTITTNLIKLDNGMCVFKATVIASDGRVLGTGHAYEKEGSSMINKTSFIENCETSAVGRALGMCGIGIDTSIASYEEVATAIAQQEATNEPRIAPVSHETPKVENKGEDKQTVPHNANKLICPVCGQVIRKYVKKDGTEIEPQAALDKVGMCIPCYMKSKKDGKHGA